jgi:hypothetical protein
VVELDAGEHLLVADAAARVAGSRSSTSCAMVRSPSPTTWPGTRLATAMSSPPTTSMRWSKPVMKVSTMTERECSWAFSNAVAHGVLVAG